MNTDIQIMHEKSNLLNILLDIMKSLLCTWVYYDDKINID